MIDNGCSRKSWETNLESLVISCILAQWPGYRNGLDTMVYVYKMLQREAHFEECTKCIL